MKKMLVLLVLFIANSLTFAQNETTGAISGHVYDAESLNPLPNVSLRVHIIPTDYFYGTTENDGFYIINLPVGNCTVTAVGSGYIDQTANEIFKIAAGDTITDIDFYLVSGGSIAGHVYDDENKVPLSGISIRGSAMDRDAVGDVQSQLDGSYLIWGKCSEGYWNVTAPSFFSDSPYILSEKTIYVQEPDTTFGVDFYLRKGGAIAGKVLDENLIPNIS